MEITRRVHDQITELTITGRLDAYWADHLSKELDGYIREGAHHLILDLSGLDYISSAGVRILVQYNKMLSEMNGHFSVSGISEPVKKVLDLSGLSDILVHKKVTKPVKKETPDIRQYEKYGTRFKISVEDESDRKPVECRLKGSPQLLNGARFSEKDCGTLSVPADDYGVGLGCLGHRFEECQSRFGEFITVAGTTSYLPSDGTNVPDFMIASATLQPEICLLYGLFFSGSFTRFIRFDVQSPMESIRLSSLCTEILESLETGCAVVTLIAETEGLVGTALRDSPVNQTTAGVPFQYPYIRKWLSFTSERAYPQNIALITGIVTQTPDEPLRPYIRPLDSQNQLYGHFHAAVFPYRPIKIGRLDIRQTVQNLYETDSILSVLHLINDDREISGAGESEFRRGACWVAPVSSFINDRRNIK